jgi:hypothetical protein
VPRQERWLGVAARKSSTGKAYFLAKQVAVARRNCSAYRGSRFHPRNLLGGSFSWNPPFMKEKNMIRLIVYVAGVVVGTLVVQHPKKVAQKVCEAAAFTVKKVRDWYPAGEPKDDRRDEGPAQVAA